ncbi:MAG: metallophosphoesterase [Candidatus Ranarchaeia archaeon]
MANMIGIMADSHDNIEMIRKAVNVFNELDVSMVLHAGDVVSPFTARVFKDLKSPLHIVFGNNDGDKISLINFFNGIGEFHGHAAIIEIKKRRIAMVHGVHDFIQDSLAQSNTFDVVVTGHTHNKQYTEIKNTLIINPGETCGYLTGQATVASLDLNTLKHTFIDLCSPRLPLPA